MIDTTRCWNCGELLNEENWNGWFEIALDEENKEQYVPMCNECNLEDDE